MPFQVFGPVALATLAAFLHRRQHRRARRLRPREVFIDVVDVDEYAVDDVRHVVPAAGNLALLAVMLWPVIVERGGGKHHHTTARVELAMREPSVLDPPVPLAESKSFDEPVHRLRPV